MKSGARVIVSGARPTGRLHLGNYHGALKNWLALQGTARCFFFVADWHALTTDYAEPQAVRENTLEMVLDWLALGIDPERSVVFQQSAVQEHAELFLLLGMLTPVPWLERNPTYKEQRDALEGRDLSTLGFWATRCCRRPMSSCTRRRPCRSASTRRRISSWRGRSCGASTGCSGDLSGAADAADGDAEAGGDRRPQDVEELRKRDLPHRGSDEIDRKLSRMVTDPRRARRNDPGEPADCPAYTSFHRAYCTPEELAWQENGCRTASIGCLSARRS
jgi:tryptophanyl-tRNA synthetase